jgi:hypothetical protein
MASLSTIPPDTSPEAYRVQTEAYRQMGGRARSAVAFRLTDLARRNAVRGIRERHPEYDDAQVRSELCRLRHGDALWRLVWPGDARPLR